MNQARVTLTNEKMVSAPAADSTIVVAEDRPWGELPLISLISAVSLLLIALADNAARSNAPGADVLFWFALLFLFVPTAYRTLFSDATRQERIALLVLAAMGMYIVKLLHSPIQFTFFDEFLHWRTANDIILTHRLFSENSLLPVSALYPGLELVTTAFSSLSGLSIFDAGLIVIGIARVLLILAMFLLFERMTQSIRLASIAVLVYMANSNFAFFDGQFSYESLALPIAAFIFCAVVIRQRSTGSGKRRLLLVITLGVVALAITHHLTLYLLTAFLLFWTLGAFLISRNRQQWKQLGIVALVMLIASVGWSQIIGNASAGYIIPVFQNGINDFIAIITNELASRQLFKSSGLVTPIWQQLIGWASVIFIMLAIPFGIYQVWRRSRANALAVTLAVLVVTYPISLGFRLTPHGWEISNRTSEFLFVAIAFVLTMAVAWFIHSHRLRLVEKIILTAWITVIFLGGIIIGWPWWAQQPGSYMVSADTRSIGPEGIEMAAWTRQYLGIDNRIGTDRINRLLLSAYGDQQPATVLNDKLDVAPLFYAPTVSPSEVKLSQALNLHYIVVDLRLSTTLPAVGEYFETDAPNRPIPLASLTKFDSLAGINRVFDSGNIAIYDVSELNHGS